MGRSYVKDAFVICVVSCLLSLSSLFINSDAFAVFQQNTETSCYTVNIAVGKVGYTGVNYNYNFFPATGTVEYIKQEPSKINNPYLSQPSFVSVYQEEETNKLQITSSKSPINPDHMANPYTVETLPKIAIEYMQRTGTTLGINDMSLIWGGLFDIDDDWMTPHITHRKGTSADIDRYVFNVTLVNHFNLL